MRTKIPLHKFLRYTIWSRLLKMSKPSNPNQWRRGNVASAKILPRTSRTTPPRVCPVSMKTIVPLSTMPSLKRL